MKRTLLSIVALVLILILALACLPAIAEEAEETAPQSVTYLGTTSRERSPEIDSTLLCYPISLIGTGYNHSYFHFIAPESGEYFFPTSSGLNFWDADGNRIKPEKNAGVYILDLLAGDVIYLDVGSRTITICNDSHHVRGEESYLTYPVSCTTDGEQAYICQLCGTMYGYEAIPATGHTLGDWGYYPAPTCTTPGAFGQLCTDCGCVLNGIDLPATGHVHSEPVVVLEPTGNLPGLVVVTCTECDEAISITVIPAVTE